VFRCHIRSSRQSKGALRGWDCQLDVLECTSKPADVTWKHHHASHQSTITAVGASLDEGPGAFHPVCASVDHGFTADTAGIVTSFATATAAQERTTPSLAASWMCRAWQPGRCLQTHTAPRRRCLMPRAPQQGDPALRLWCSCCNVAALAPCCTCPGAQRMAADMMHGVLAACTTTCWHPCTT
jgi:hypothetical protein